MTRFASSFAILLAAGSTWAAPPAVNGEYDSPLGRVRVSGDGTTYVGTLVAPGAACAFAAGAEVLRGTLLDDSLAGQVRVCQTGAGCEPEAWARAVLLVAPGGLSGAAHVKKGCQAPLGKSGGIAFTRAAPPRPAARPPPKAPAPVATEPPTGPRPPPGPAARDRAHALLKDGAAWLQEGSFERARRRFEEAIALDARLPEAYNGVGVTYRMRNDLTAAMGWYKRALGVDPDFGDAYYNMACVYALDGKPELALRYLQIAAMNGFATAEVIDQDPDLESLRATPAYQALLRVGP